MTLFEYIAVANSIILSFALLRLLDAIPHAFNRTQRFWTHCAFLVAITWACVQYWWVSWSYSTVESWTYPKFIVYLVTPALLYSLARTIASPDPSRVDSFREHFGRIRCRFFVLLSIYMITILLGSWFIAGVPFRHPLRLMQGLVVLASASGALVSNPRYIAALAAFYLLGMAATTLVVFSQPAPLPTP